MKARESRHGQQEEVGLWGQGSVCSAPLPAFSFCFTIQEARERVEPRRVGGVECVKL